jgi:signal transduction histidine kinase
VIQLPGRAERASAPSRLLQSLSARAALAALGGATVGALTALGALLALVPASMMPERATAPISLAVTIVAAAVGAALGTWWWTTRAVNRVRSAVAANEQALADAGERRAMEASQRNAYAAVGDFATELARELAPSVASARTAVRTLERSLHPDAPACGALDMAQRELHRLANTLQDTLRLARSGRLEPRRLDLWVPLRNALKAATPAASTRGIWLEPPPFGRAPVWINGDAAALEQLFLNLLLNAVQETDAGGRVSAAVRVEDDAVVSIADTGRGIAQGALDRVFEPFFTTKPDAAGLGLAIAWRTAAAHGGRITIESALGRGTTVDVALPRADGAGELVLDA